MVCRQRTCLAGWVAAAWALCGLPIVAAAALPRIQVSPDRRGFVDASTGQAFLPWGFNYDHDQRGRLIEDYWDTEWQRVAEDFGEMRALGANVVRIHLQLGKFLEAPDTLRSAALDRLEKLLDLAEANRLYLNLTGLGCYHRGDVPGWYDRLPEAERWRVQSRFWEGIARRCAGRTVVFCYDLMNEPVVAGAPRGGGEWLGPPFAGKHFVQFVSLDPGGRARHEVARQWIGGLRSAIRAHDAETLLTVGLVDWSLDRPGLTSGFVPDRIGDLLDFLCVHLYPEQNQVESAVDTLRGFAGRWPVLIEETFPLRCGPDQFAEFLDRSREHSAGVLGFYWGQTAEECRATGTIADGLMAQWLTLFAERARGRVLPVEGRTRP